MRVYRVCVWGHSCLYILAMKEMLCECTCLCVMYMWIMIVMSVHILVASLAPHRTHRQMQNQVANITAA